MNSTRCTFLMLAILWTFMVQRLQHVHTMVSEELVDFKHALDNAADAFQEIKETTAVASNAQLQRQRRNNIDEILNNYQNNLRLDLEREALNFDDYNSNSNSNSNNNNNNNMNYNNLQPLLERRVCKRTSPVAASNALTPASALTSATTSQSANNKLNLNDELNELVRANSRFQNLHKQLLNSFRSGNSENYINSWAGMLPRSSSSSSNAPKSNTNANSASSDKKPSEESKQRKPSGTVETANSNTKGKSQSIITKLNYNTFLNPQANENTNTNTNTNSNMNSNLNSGNNGNSGNSDNSNANTDTNTYSTFENSDAYKNKNANLNSHSNFNFDFDSGTSGISGTPHGNAQHDTNSDTNSAGNANSYISCRPMSNGAGASSSSTLFEFNSDASAASDAKPPPKSNSNGKLNTILLLEADTIRNSMHGKNTNRYEDKIGDVISGSNFFNNIHYNSNGEVSSKNNNKNNINMEDVNDHRGWIDSYDSPHFMYSSDNRKTNNEKADDDVITYEKTIENIHFPSIVNDQFDVLRNDLSHEANYKLSKVEQDQAEHARPKLPVQISEQLVSNRAHRRPAAVVQGKPHAKSPLKRSTGFNALDEIKLKTSARLMRKGLGPSLPSYALSDTRREMQLDNEVRRLEKEFDAAPKHDETDKYEAMLSVDDEQWQERLKRLEDLEQRSLDQVLSGGIPELSMEKNKPPISKVDEILLDPTFDILRTKRVDYPKEDDIEMPQKTSSGNGNSVSGSSSTSGGNMGHNIMTGDGTDAEDEISVFHLPDVVALGSAEQKAPQQAAAIDNELKSTQDEDMRNIPVLEVGAPTKTKRNNNAYLDAKHMGRYKYKRELAGVGVGVNGGAAVFGGVPKRRVKRIGVLNAAGQITGIREMDMAALMDAGKTQAMQTPELLREKRESLAQVKNEKATAGDGKLSDGTFAQNGGARRRAKRAMPILAEEIFDDDSMHTLELSRVRRELPSVTERSAVLEHKHRRSRRDTSKVKNAPPEALPAPVAQKTRETKKTDEKNATTVAVVAATTATTKDAVASTKATVTTRAAVVASNTDTVANTVTNESSPHVMGKRASIFTDAVEENNVGLNSNTFDAAIDAGSDVNFIGVDAYNDIDDGDDSLGSDDALSGVGDAADSINVGDGDVMHEDDYNDFAVVRRKRISTQDDHDFAFPVDEFGSQKFDNLKQRDEHARTFDGLKMDNLWYGDIFNHMGNNNRRDNDHEFEFNNQNNNNKKKNGHKSVMTIAIENGAIKSINRNDDGNQYEENNGAGATGMSATNSDGIEEETPSEDIPPRTQKQSFRGGGGTDKSMTVTLKDQVLNCTAFSSLENFLRTLQQQNKSGAAGDGTGGSSSSCGHNANDGNNAMNLSGKANDSGNPNCNGNGNANGAGNVGKNKTDFNSNADTIDTDIKINAVTLRPMSGNNTPSNGQHKPMKLNITISASVTGDQKAKNFIGNGTIKVQSEERERRNINFGHIERFAKRKCPHINKNPCKQANSQDDGPVNKGSMEVVKSLFGLVKCNPELKLLWPSLRRNEMCIHNTPRAMSAINKMPKDETSRIEEMMETAMQSINDMIESQVESRSCVPLRPDLKSFYDQILQMYSENDEMARSKRDNAVSLSDEFSKEVRLIDPNKVEERSRIVKKLLRQYDDLPMEDQEQMIDVRNDLMQNLNVLRQIQVEQEQQQQQQQVEPVEDVQMRRRRQLLDQLDFKPEDVDVMKKYNLDYTPEYLKLLKASELMQEANIEPQQHQNRR